MYVELSDLEAAIPPAFLTQSLDDDGDGAQDAWTKVQARACAEVDGRLGGRYATPFPEPYPAIVKEAAFVFAADLCYRRRGKTGDENPWEEQAKEFRTRLKMIAKGDAPLDPAVQRSKPSGSIIAEPAKTHSATGQISL